MQLLAVLQVQLLVAVSASQLDLSLGTLEQPPEDLCARGATAANLGANKLRAVPPCCPSFRALQVHRNDIEELPEDWLLHCPHLEELSVSGNKLRRLPPRLLGSSSSLRRLQASRNLLETLPAELLTNATSLTELDLSHNRLSELPPGFLDANTQLEELYLQGNSLVSLGEGVLVACSRLRRLWLSGNLLSRLPEALLASAHDLTTLRLEDNQLDAVDAGAFRNNQKLVLVDLSSNKLTSLPPGLFANATSLRHLLLRDNQLCVVPAAGTLPEQRISLDLRDNCLATVEDFGAFGESRVWLDGNGWRCGSSLAPVPREATSIDTIPTTLTSGPIVWKTEDNSSLSASSRTENSVPETPNVPTHETSPLEIDNEVDLAQGFLPVAYNTTADGGNNNSLKTDLSVASSVATTTDVNTSQTSEPQTNANETAIFLTSDATVHSDISDQYDGMPSS